ncbi:ASCH domain-containing protein [Streptomyces sp. NBC_01264]|uniref:ASCH domain-containing protein n=1 Tax=Streptomyces sp. NBC_01264 TaxID=2903804 RepID=UPI0022565084|nr:ASCH domain-containing protein [Streptomyces sp. NBC_01264]MCX4777352.1 ASCH domain-containing protein [Streptomyces sp. NBC_01264]
MTGYEDLPPIEFAFPGPLRDSLVAAVLSGAKTTTTAVLADYEAAGDPLPVAGERMVIVDSGGRPVGVLEVTDVRVLRLADVDLRHALDEGEGFTSVAEWRSGHEAFWHGPQMREAVGDPDFTVDDDTPVVAERFRLVTRLP